MGCKCARYDGEDGRWQCSVSGDGCMFMIPNAKACGAIYGEGPTVTDNNVQSCPQCGNSEISADDKYCGICGKKIGI